LLQGIIPQFFFRYVPCGEDCDAVERARRCFVETNDCWKQLHVHIGDEELCNQLIQDFLQHYEQTLTDMSCWIDDFQLRLVISQFELDIDKALKDIQVRFLSLSWLQAVWKQL